MEITIDKFGRVVLPKKMRQHFGLKPGSKIEIEEHTKYVKLIPLYKEHSLTKKGRVLVYVAESSENIDDALEQDRLLRDKDILGE